MRTPRLVLSTITSTLLAAGVLAVLPAPPAQAATPPTIAAAATSSKPKSAAGWYRAPVTITFTCTDGSSPIVGGCPAPFTAVTSQEDLIVTRTVTNGDGLSATVTVSDIDIDTILPTVRIKGVVGGQTYLQKKKPRCVVIDTLSGVASCKLKQKKKGDWYKVIAKGKDKADNVYKNTVSYRVK